MRISDKNINFVLCHFQRFVLYLQKKSVLRFYFEIDIERNLRFVPNSRKSYPSWFTDTKLSSAFTFLCWTIQSLCRKRVSLCLLSMHHPMHHLFTCLNPRCICPPSFLSASKLVIFVFTQTPIKNRFNYNMQKCSHWPTHTPTQTRMS